MEYELIAETDHCVPEFKVIMMRNNRNIKVDQLSRDAFCSFLHILLNY